MSVLRARSHASEPWHPIVGTLRGILSGKCALGVSWPPPCVLFNATVPQRTNVAQAPLAFDPADIYVSQLFNAPSDKSHPRHWATAVVIANAAAGPRPGNSALIHRHHSGRVHRFVGLRKAARSMSSPITCNSARPRRYHRVNVDPLRPEETADQACRMHDLLLGVSPLFPGPYMSTSTVLVGLTAPFSRG